MTRPNPPVSSRQAVASKLLAVLQGEVRSPPPLWLMRQAGRYLPEYRDLRARARSFLDFCLTPALAVEASLQPIRRFGFDAAILFSDILVVPHALGQAVHFEEGQGPLLERVQDAAALARLSFSSGRLEPVYETVAELRASLPQHVALIGFAGGPWTVAAYMVEGGSSHEFAAVKSWAYRDPDGFARLLDLLVEATSIHLIRQIEAGAQVVQLFESWAGALPADGIEAWGLEPARRTIAAVKAAHPDIPVILFPRGAGTSYPVWAGACGAECIGLDTGVSPDWAATELSNLRALQGNLDPVALLTGGPALERAATRILDRLGSRPFVFNLGHGVLPQTPPENVAELVAIVRRDRG